MVHEHTAALLIYVLIGASWVQGSDEGKILIPPELNASGDYTVINRGASLTLTCRGSSQLTWVWGEDQTPVGPRFHVAEHRCHGEAHRHLTCSRLTLSTALVSDTGYFTCLYSSVLAPSGHTGRIYVFVKDLAQPFVHPVQVIEVAYMYSDDELVVPCRVSSPEFNVSLSLFRNPVYDSSVVVWDPKRGFVVPYPSSVYQRVLTCRTQVNGMSHAVYYLPRKVVNEIYNMSVHAEQEKLLVGDTLSLICSAHTRLNGRARLDWSLNGEIDSRVRPSFHAKRHENLVYGNLTRVNVSMEDRGVYTCQANMTNGLKQKNITIQIYKKAFIKVSQKKNLLHTVTEGRKQVKLSVKVDAFPHPDVTWYKDGQLIGKNNSCYEPDPVRYRLIIKHVREKDAGKYTMVLNNTRHGLSTNVTFGLIVNSSNELLALRRCRMNAGSH